MTDTPDDLISMPTVLKEYKPARKWWKSHIDSGEIIAYRVPGIRGIFLSRADVERLLRPQPLYILPKPKDEPTE
jgi:hypothetical protein